jgi:hypothetical protein
MPPITDDPSVPQPKPQTLPALADPAETVLDLLSSSGKAIGALQTNVIRAIQEMKRIKVVPADWDKIDRHIAVIFEEVEAAKRRLKARNPSVGCSSVDERDNPLPDDPGILEAFAFAGEFRDLRNLNRVYTMKVNALRDACPWFGHQEAASYLDKLDAFLRFTQPYSVCPYCRGGRTSCDGCEGRGWVTKSIYDQAPAEKKAALAVKGAA